MLWQTFGFLDRIFTEMVQRQARVLSRSRVTRGTDTRLLLIVRANLELSR